MSSSVERISAEATSNEKSDLFITGNRIKGIKSVITFRKFGPLTAKPFFLHCSFPHLEKNDFIVTILLYLFILT